MCDLETSRMGAPYMYDISRLRVKAVSNKVSNIIRRLMDNMKLLLICILLLSHSLGSIFYQCIYCCIPVLCCNLCIFIVISVRFGQ